LISCLNSSFFDLGFPSDQDRERVSKWAKYPRVDVITNPTETIYYANLIVLTYDGLTSYASR